MLTEEQAVRLQEAGLYAYNHNLDTSEEYYKEIISTRKFDNRINTINNVRKAGITVCSGGIIGLGETHRDRIAMLLTLATMPKHPESVPINALARVKGTPLERQSKSRRVGYGAYDCNRQNCNACIYRAPYCRPY
jgi:biotin synthase